MAIPRFPAPPIRGDIGQMNKNFFSRLDPWMDYLNMSYFKYKCEYCATVNVTSKTNCCPTCGGPRE